MRVLALVALLAILFLMSTLAGNVSATTTGIDTRQALNISLHVFAHLDVGPNPASNYDPDYVHRAGSQVTASHRELAQFVQEFPDLNLLTVIPVYFTEVDHFLKTLRVALNPEENQLDTLPLSEAAAAQGLQPFLSRLPKRALQLFVELAASTQTALAELEATVWARQQSRREWLQDFWDHEGEKAISSFFAANGFYDFWITASPAMRNNGRGFPGLFPGQAAAVTLLPESAEAVFFSYSLAVHEMIHQVTDSVVYSVLQVQPEDRSIDPNDSLGMGIHIQLENAVILTQYWIMKAHDPAWAEDYLLFMSDWSGEPYADLEALRNRFPVQQELEPALRTLLTP